MWHSPNGRDRDQTDTILMNGRWRQSLQDVKVRRGADVGSDHHIVKAMKKMKIKGIRHKRIARNISDFKKRKGPLIKQKRYS